VNNNLARLNEELIEVIEFKDVHNKDRKENNVREVNILSSSITFIKLSRQFNTDAAEEEDLNADVKVINKEKSINFFIILTK